MKKLGKVTYQILNGEYTGYKQPIIDEKQEEIIKKQIEIKNRTQVKEELLEKDFEKSNLQKTIEEEGTDKSIQKVNFYLAKNSLIYIS